MPNSAILGLARAFARGPTVEAQHATLLSVGVPERFIYTDELDSRAMFGELIRALRKGDTLAVPCLAVFAHNHAEVSAGLASLDTKSVGFWSIEDDIDTRQADPRQLYKLNKAERRAEAMWNRERTVAASGASRRSGRAGPRPKLGRRALAAAELAWRAATGPDAAKTNIQLAAEIGLSAGRLFTLFGRRADRE